MKKLITIFLILLISSVYAQKPRKKSKKKKMKELVEQEKRDRDYERDRLFKRENPDKLKTTEINQFKDIFLYENSVLYEETADELYADDYYTGKDNNRFFMTYQFSSDYEEQGALTSLEFGYQRKMKNFKDTWLTMTLKRTVAEYDEVANEMTSSGTNADGNTQRFSEKQTFTTVGGGVGYRFRALSDLVQSDRFFETCHALLTYSSHLDNATGKEYNGFGLNTDYGLHYRSSSSFYYGGKLSHNILPMVREPIDDEKRQQRSIVFGWTSIGFEIGYFY